MSSADPTTEREFDQMVERLFASGVISPVTVREKLLKNYGRYMVMYRDGAKKETKVSKPSGKGKKKVKKVETKVSNRKPSGSVEPKSFGAKDIKSEDFFKTLDEKEQKEIIDLQMRLTDQLKVPKNLEFDVTEKQAKKDDILFRALSAKQVNFVPKYASMMRRKGNSKVSDPVIATEECIGFAMFKDMAAKCKDLSKLRTIGAETADWLSTLKAEEQNVLRPFVRVPDILKGFFQEPEISKKR